MEMKSVSQLALWSATNNLQPLQSEAAGRARGRETGCGADLELRVAIIGQLGLNALEKKSGGNRFLQ